MLTTSAMTGLRMKRSVKLFESMVGGSPGESGVGRGRRRAAGRLDDVVHLHGGAVAELEHAGGDDLLAGLHALGDGDEVAAGGAQFDELLADAEFPRRAGRAEEFARVALFIIENTLLNGDVIRLDAGTRPPARTQWSQG